MWIMIAIYCGNKKVQLGSRVGTVGNILFGYDDYRINSEQRATATRPLLTVIVIQHILSCCELLCELQTRDTQVQKAWTERMVFNLCATRVTNRYNSW